MIFFRIIILILFTGILTQINAATHDTCDAEERKAPVLSPLRAIDDGITVQKAGGPLTTSSFHKKGCRIFLECTWEYKTPLDSSVEAGWLKRSFQVKSFNDLTLDRLGLVPKNTGP